MLLRWTPPKNVIKDALSYRVLYHKEDWNTRNTTEKTMIVANSQVKLYLGYNSTTSVTVWAATKDNQIHGIEKTVFCKTSARQSPAKPDFDFTIMQSRSEIFPNGTIVQKANVLIKWKPNFESSSPPGSYFDIEYKKHSDINDNGTHIGLRKYSRTNDLKVEHIIPPHAISSPISSLSTHIITPSYFFFINSPGS